MKAQKEIGQVTSLTQTVFDGLHGNFPAKKVLEANAQFLKHRIHQPFESLGHLLLIRDTDLIIEHLPQPSEGPKTESGVVLTDLNQLDLTEV